MSRVKQITDNSFWKRLYALSKLAEPKTASKLAHEFGVEEEQIKSDIMNAADYGLKMKFEQIGHDFWVIPSDEQTPGVDVQLSAFEWSHLNHFFTMALQRSEFAEFHHLLLQLKQQSENLTEFDQLTSSNAISLELNPFKERTIQRIEEGIVTKSLVQIHFADSKKKVIYPIRIVHLEGELSLVGEDSHDHCLFVMNLSEMTRVSVMAQSYIPQVTPFELEEFISAIRNMNEKETRLILKIHDPESVNLFPNYHFLGKPCMITNPSGDLIWAAYVEPCADLYDWLIELGNKVEILDPVQFKAEYLGYCEEKLSKIA